MSDLVYFHKSKLDALADKINEKCGGIEPLLSADNWREVTPEAKAEIEKQQQTEVMI